MAVGNVSRALATIKTNVDSGCFARCRTPRRSRSSATKPACQPRTYERRRDAVLEWLPAAGLAADKPLGGLYVWARTPAGVDAEAWAISALERTGVWLTPGTAFGPHGAGHLRISICVPEERLREAGKRLSAL